MRYLSTKPRFGALAAMSRVSKANSSVLAVSTSSTSNNRTHPINDRDSGVRDTQPQEKRQRVAVEEAPVEAASARPAAADEEIPRSLPTHALGPESISSADPIQSERQNIPTANHIRLHRYKGLYVEEFPDATAGAPISNERVPPRNLDAYMHACGPMADPEHFEVAELLMTSKLTDVDKDRHLKSRKYAGKTPWSHCGAMVSDVDRLTHGPEFKKGLVEVFDGRRPRPGYMVYRNIIEVIRDFLANSAFNSHIRYKPWRLYTSASKKTRVYGDMAASNWWWRELEKLIAKGKQYATIVPLIIATDQTTLSVMCGGQKAYPVYVTFGNLDKDWRRKPSKHGMYLLGYLPVDAFEDVPNKDERQRLKADLVHRAMEKMLEPLRVASEEGVEMWCPDGRMRRIYPRIAAYTADWPEQSLQACTSEGRCPVCKTEYSKRGDFEDEAERREREETLGALRTYFRTKNEAHLDLLGLKPVWPWWGDIPDVNLHDCIAPDLLHQAYQGLFKTHLVQWMKKLHTPKELDQRFAAMPQAEGLKRFPKGLSAISKNRWTGRESKQVLAQFLPAVVSGLTPELAKMVRVLVDFMYRAHATTLTDTDLNAMEDNLATFHELKENLVGAGKVYKTDRRFHKIAKLHMLRHWIHAIRELGTPDGFNTEAPENLHIEYAKVPWRASNKVEPLEQMVRYIQRQEAIRVHRAYLDEYLATDCNDGDEGEDTEEWDLEELIEHPITDDLDYTTGRLVNQEGPAESADGAGDEENDIEPIYYPNPTRHLAAAPTVEKIRIQDVVDDYHASNLISGITDFLTRRCGVNRQNVLMSPENFISVWHKLYLYHPAPPFAPFDPVRRDVVRARPPRNREPGVWDVALYLERPNRLRASDDMYEKHGIERYRAGRVRAIFNLPAHLRLFYPGPLAYLEVFTPFDSTPSPFTRLHSTKFDFDSRGRRRTLVVPVSDIIFASHLVPKYHTIDFELHAYTDLLSVGEKFWLNHYYNHHMFQFIQHWRRRRPTLAERLRYNLQRTETTGTPSNL
ncbi:hypothetical protein RSOL_027710, partial [Rhizoctonia solani AG-3 Rhs1AP]